MIQTMQVKQNSKLTDFVGLPVEKKGIQTRTKTIYTFKQTERENSKTTMPIRSTTIKKTPQICERELNCTRKFDITAGSNSRTS